MFLRLGEWAEARFATPPARDTLCRWAREGMIPGARKIGRDWYVPAESLPAAPAEDYAPSEHARRILGCA